MQDPVSVKDVQKRWQEELLPLTVHPQSCREKIAFLPSSPKFKELSVVRISEKSFPRTQRLSVKHD
jgi:hypothetical protein